MQLSMSDSVHCWPAAQPQCRPGYGLTSSAYVTLVARFSEGGRGNMIVHTDRDLKPGQQ